LERLLGTGTCRNTATIWMIRVQRAKVAQMSSAQILPRRMYSLVKESQTQAPSQKRMWNVSKVCVGLELTDREK
jgi:hypothetical protein